MPRAPLRLARAALACLAVPLVAGCAGLATLGAVTSPIELYDLTPKSTFDEDLPEVTAQLVVEEPTAASSVNTDRIAVKPNAYKVEYFPDARWVDRAPLMVQTRLVESFENTGRVGSVGRQAIGLSSDYTLITELREFQAHVGAGEDGPLGVLVQLNMKVVQEPRGLIVASRSFGRKVEVGSDEIIDVVAAFDAGLGQTMRDAVDWTVREIADIEQSRRVR